MMAWFNAGIAMAVVVATVVIANTTTVYDCILLLAVWWIAFNVGWLVHKGES